MSRSSLKPSQSSILFPLKSKDADGVQSTASGLQYKVLEPGAGDTYPAASDRVKVHYHGTLIDGTVFDSSVDRGEPISFGLNQVIVGWTEGLQLMVEGEKTRIAERLNHSVPSNNLCDHTD